jgi:hypothetical protein
MQKAEQTEKQPLRSARELKSQGKSKPPQTRGYRELQLARAKISVGAKTRVGKLPL